MYATGAREIERVRSGGERKRVLENQNETNKPAKLYLFILFVLTSFKKKFQSNNFVYSICRHKKMYGKYMDLKRRKLDSA